MFTLHPPFYTISAALSFYYKARNGEIPPRPEGYFMDTLGLEEEVWELMRSCWSVRSGDRPTASEVQVFFSQMKASRAK
jgi:hypothetical protein